MQTYYFSFGQDHTHYIGGITLDADVLLKVTASDSDVARQCVFDAIGPRWSMQYSEDDVNFAYFPRGSVTVPGIGDDPAPSEGGAG